MRKTSILLLIGMFAALLVLSFSFTGCENLKLDNLKANDHLNKGNKYYRDEKFAKAVKEYEQALELNPKLELIYFHVGTAYASLYRPGRGTDRNEEYAQEAVEYLQKALENDPENEQIYLALGDIFDKMENAEEAEKYYLRILENEPDNPKSYYILADFYSKYDQEDKSGEMFKKRIALDPKDPEGYLYYANYLQNKRKWYEAMDAFESMIIAMTAPEIQMERLEIQELERKVSDIEKIEEYLDKHVRKNRTISADARKQMIEEKEQQIREIGDKEALEKALAEKREAVNAKLEGLKEIQDQMPGEKKTKLSEAYYSLGVVCWFKSFQTPIDMMSAQERRNVLDRGFQALERSVELNPTYAEPWAYSNLLWREMIKVEPLKREEFTAKAQEDVEKFQRLRQRQLAMEEKMKKLEQLGG
ncbi:MAG TPA: tetratricopeptide repeat protein [Candidatus Aminicenantes bacterium]|nr:tetratricopeptide repeat protein [Candidatus Aminicenantes bacterium]